jgi:hypothetical protein
MDAIRMNFIAPFIPILFGFCMVGKRQGGLRNSVAVDLAYINLKVFAHVCLLTNRFFSYESRETAKASPVD